MNFKERLDQILLNYFAENFITADLDHIISRCTMQCTLYKHTCWFDGTTYITFGQFHGN